MFTRLFLGLAWLAHWLPARALAQVGRAIGSLAFELIRPRRHVVLVNLARCFPSLDERARHALARDHFRSLGQALLESTIGWWGTPERLRALMQIEGLAQAQARCKAGEILIFMCPHFVGMELAGARIALEMGGMAFYSKQKNKVFDAFLAGRRQRFHPIRLLARQDGVKPVIRGLREGVPLFYPPDLDFGPRDAVFAPFFGVPAATITALPRLARMTGAKVVVVIPRQGAPGEPYRITITPPLDDFPSASVEADVARLNQFIEDAVRPIPAQYYWVHKRFKTRPPGEPGFY
jgi:Kdo2-lipid IVA lauroyltransferase/acyltransferase